MKWFSISTATRRPSISKISDNSKMTCFEEIKDSKVFLKLCARTFEINLESMF